MPHYSHGPSIQRRTKLLFEGLLAYASDELEDTEKLRSDLKVNLHSEENKLIVRTKLRTLVQLMKDEGFGEFTKDQIREAIHHLENYLEILDDHRETSSGSEDWHFTLMLWSKDKAENLQRFDAEWKIKLPLKALSLRTEPGNVYPEAGSELQASEATVYANCLKEAETMSLPIEADGAVEQVMAKGITASGDIEAEDLTQKASRGSVVKQEMLIDIQAQNIKLGNLLQES